MSKSKAAIKAKITSALRKGVRGSRSTISSLIPKSFTSGKTYEAYVLGLVCQRLKNKEGLTLTLSGSTMIALKSSPGPINHTFPHIKVHKGTTHIGNIWTDIEFSTLSAAKQKVTALTPGHYHELDIAFVLPSAKSRPYPNEILLGVECKNTGYQKHLLREILGIRRELSFLSDATPTSFSYWPRSTVPADPPSCIAVFSSDSAVLSYQAPGTFFGIDFFHEPL